jgi:hypothetical protein
MATATSYALGDRPSERGARESLDNTLRRTAVEQTPMFSLLPRGPKATAMFSEWLVDDLSNVSFPGVIDGKPLKYTGGVEDANGVATTDDFVDKTSDRARLGNRIQQIERTFAVTPQAQAVSVAGPNDLYGSSKARALIELKRDIEALICSDTDIQTGDGGQGDLMAGLGTWTDPTNTSIYSTSGKQKYRAVGGSRFDLSESLNPTGGGAGQNMTEGDFRDLLQAVYENHGNASTYRLVAGPEVINQVSDFTRLEVTNHASYQLTQNVGDGVLRLSVQEYISDWGRVFLVPTLLAGFSSGGTLGDTQRRRGYLIPGDSHIQLRYLEDINSIDLVDPDGGGKRGLVRTMLTLCPTAGSKPLGSIV